MIESKAEDPGIDYETQAIIPDGKIVDYITGQWVKETEQEKVRQNFERTLTEEYNYLKEDIRFDLKIKAWDGSNQRTKKVPLAVMREGTEDPYILILINKPNSDPTDKKNGANDLEQWLIDVQSAEFGCWTNGIETLYFQKKKSKFDADVFPINDFPQKGEDASSIYTTDRRRLRVATGNNLLYAFKRCHDYIHANQGGSKEQIFWEFLKILFAKVEDETHGGRPRFAIRSAEERNAPDGRKEVKDRIEGLFREVKERKEFAGLFEAQAAGILFNPETVSYIVSQLEKYDFIPERKKFVPHITLARFKRGGKSGNDKITLPTNLTENSFGINKADEIILYSSDLTENGPLYSVVDRWKFNY